MKKIIVAALLILSMGVMTACGNSAQSSETSSVADEMVQETIENAETEIVPETESESTEEVASTEESSETEETEQDDTAGSNTLVVYFSWSGNTRQVAELLQTRTGADIFEIVPETPYTDDYDAVVDQAQQEQSDGARPAIADTVPNIDDYDTILFGFPNWWGDMPMIMYTFLDDYDLSGKTIAPFATSASSGLSDSVNSIQNEEPDATVVEGLSIRESNLEDADSAVAEWLNELGLTQ